MAPDASLMPAPPLRLRNNTSNTPLNTSTSSFLASRHPASSIVASILAFHLGHDTVSGKYIQEISQEQLLQQSRSECASSFQKNIDCYDNHDVWLILRDGVFLVRLLHATAPPPTTPVQTSDARENIVYFLNNLPTDLRSTANITSSNSTNHNLFAPQDLLVLTHRFSIVLDTVINLHQYHLDQNQHKLAIPALSKSSSYRPPARVSSPTKLSSDPSPSLMSTNPNNGKLLLPRRSLKTPTPLSSPALSSPSFGSPALSSSFSDISSRGDPSPASSPDLSPTPPYDIPSTVSSASSRKDSNNNNNNNGTTATPVSLLFGRRPSPLINFPALPLSPPVSPFTPTSNLTSSPSLNRAKLVVTDKGRTLVTYLLAECIGKGQFGTVYRALNLNSGRVVAVKRIDIQDKSEEEIMQLSHEVHVLKTMAQHPCIVQYEGLVKTEDHVHIILEYAENGSLLNTLKDFGNLPEGLVASYVVKILDGLHYLHSHEIVHCDLKAANILTTKNGNIKLSDFGVSLNMKALQTSDDNNNVAGSPYWMAPEVILLRGASPASDIWSLGCTIIELITGHPPYSHLVTLSAMFRIVEDAHPPIPPDVSTELSQFLLQCFRKNSKDRPLAKDLADHIWLTKYSSVFGKALRPQDSLPVFPRLSLDMLRGESSDSSYTRPPSSSCSSMDEISSSWTKEGHMSPSTTDTSRYSLSSAGGGGDCCCNNNNNAGVGGGNSPHLSHSSHKHHPVAPASAVGSNQRWFSTSSSSSHNKTNISSSSSPLININNTSINTNTPSSLALWPKHTSLPPLFSESDDDKKIQPSSSEDPPATSSFASPPPVTTSVAESLSQQPQRDTSQPHCFVKGHFSKHVECKLCKLPVKKHAALCPDCGLICHVRCSKDKMFSKMMQCSMSNHQMSSKSSPSLSPPEVEDIRRSQSHPQPQSHPPRTRHSMDEHLRGLLPPFSPLPSLLHAPSILNRRKHQAQQQQEKPSSSSSMIPSRTMSFSIGSSHSLPSLHHHRRHRRHLSAIESANTSKKNPTVEEEEFVPSTDDDRLALDALARRTRRTSLRNQISDQGEKLRNNVHWLMGLLPRRRDPAFKSYVGDDERAVYNDEDGEKKTIKLSVGNAGCDPETDEDDHPIFQPSLYHKNGSGIGEDDEPTKSFSTLKPYPSPSPMDDEEDEDEEKEFQFHALSSPPSLQAVSTESVTSSITSKISSLTLTR